MSHSGIVNKIPDKSLGMHYLLKDFSQNKGKFSPNAKKSIFLGFNQNTQCYIIMDYEDHKLHHDG
ncbi:hypothetical protein H8356DRAFT_1338052 [Neocallimastix lanati (nom. inval.)]|nr:hypothetical protein H8356DRAFT_1338052 [Neocallimastix sp. JGI-2020a]